MPKTARLELRVEPELIARIDAARGDVPRARWVQRALEGVGAHTALARRVTELEGNRWATFSDDEFAVIWWGVLYDDGIRYWPDAIDTGPEDVIMREVVDEQERRGMSDEELIKRWRES